MALSGIGFGALGPLYLTVQYERVPRESQAHVFGLTFGLQTAGEALGAALAGLALTYFTIRQTLLGMGTIMPRSSSSPSYHPPSSPSDIEVSRQRTDALARPSWRGASHCT
jgi:MFS family permease